MKRIKTLFFAVVFCLTALIGCLPSLQFANFSHTASAATVDYSFKSEFNIANANFKQNTPSNSSPNAPSSWTGTAGTNVVNADSLKTGLIEISKYGENVTNWGFSSNSPLDNPDTFGDITNAFSTALMINAGTSDAIYTYSTADFTLKANSYLCLDFSAYADVIGEISVGFSASEMNSLIVPITTNTQRWNDYHVYIKGSAYADITTKMVINFGLEVKENTALNISPVRKLASGALFVGNIKTVLLTPEDYTSAKKLNENQAGFMFWQAKDYTKTLLSNPEKSTSSWTLDATSTNTGFTSLNTDTTNNFNKAEDKLTNPKAPFSKNGVVYMASGTKVSSVTATLSTKDDSDITIPRFGFMRVSAWVNTVNLTSGSATVSVTKGTFDDENTTSDEPKETVSITSFEAQNVDSWTTGWSEAVLYVKGSPFGEQKVKFSIGVSGLVGDVYFDYMSYSAISGADYEKYASSSTAKKLEMAASAVADKLVNGSFNIVGAVKENDILLPAKDWTVDATASSVSGITGLDKYYYNALDLNKLGLRATDFPAIGDNGKNNSLVIVHKEAAATTYTSTELATLTESVNDVEVPVSKIAIVVTLANKLSDPKNAKLQLLVGDKVISEIGNLESSTFESYAFNITQSATAGYKYKLRIAVGNKDANISNQPTGSFWVSQVYAGKYDFDKIECKSVVGVDLSGDLFGSIVTDNELFHTNYAWAVDNRLNENSTMGFVKTKDFPSGLSAYSEMFKNSNSPYAMLLSASTPAYIGFKQNFAISYSPSTYAKVSLRIKTRGFAKGEGATIKLGDKQKFENVNTEYLHDYELTEDMREEYDLHTYKGWWDYSFLVNVGGAAETSGENTATKVETQLGVYIGNSLNSLRKGTILIDNVSVETLDKTTYEESLKALDMGNKTPANLVKADLSGQAESIQNGSTSIDKSLNMDTMYIVIGSTLAGLIVLFLLYNLIKSLRSRRKVTVNTDNVVSYDRSKVQENYDNAAIEKPDEFMEEETEFTKSSQPIKQARTVRGLKRQQERQKLESRTMRTERRKGLNKEQETALLAQLMTREIYVDPIDDFKD